MNHTGIAVDMAHAGDRTTLDAVDCSREPVIVSHGNARARCDTPRNYGDDALRALAECGGVIGITAYGPLCETKPGGGRPTLDDMIDHIAYVADTRAVVDHVGIGSDFFESGVGSALPCLLSAFVIRRCSATTGSTTSISTISTSGPLSATDRGPCSNAASRPRRPTKILGGNFMRVFERVWKA